MEAVTEGVVALVVARIGKCMALQDYTTSGTGVVETLPRYKMEKVASVRSKAALDIQVASRLETAGSRKVLEEMPCAAAW